MLPETPFPCSQVPSSPLGASSRKRPWASRPARNPQALRAFLHSSLFPDGKCSQSPEHLLSPEPAPSQPPLAFRAELLSWLAPCPASSQAHDMASSSSHTPGPLHSPLWTCFPQTLYLDY